MSVKCDMCLKCIDPGDYAMNVYRVKMDDTSEVQVACLKCISARVLKSLDMKPSALARLFMGLK